MKTAALNFYIQRNQPIFQEDLKIRAALGLLKRYLYLKTGRNYSLVQWPSTSRVELTSFNEKGGYSNIIAECWCVAQQINWRTSAPVGTEFVLIPEFNWTDSAAKLCRGPYPGTDGYDYHLVKRKGQPLGGTPMYDHELARVFV